MLNSIFQHIAMSLIIVGTCTSCTSYQTQQTTPFQNDLDAQFSTSQDKFKDPIKASSEKPIEIPIKENWYESFEIPQLNQLISQSLDTNLTLKQSWSRLRQAELELGVSKSNQFPSVNLGADLATQKIQSAGWNNSLSISANLNWEIDLWQRIRFDKLANQTEYQATQADFKSTSLLVTAQVTRLYFNILQQTLLKTIVKRQITTNQQFLDLTSLRKSTGQGSLLDIQQQRQQLLTTESQLPQIEQILTAQQHAFASLLGISPIHFQLTPKTLPNKHAHLPGLLPKLPNLPILPSPQDLITLSPDLYAAHLRLKAIDYQVAIAAANRLPRISLSSAYQISNEKIQEALDINFFNLAINLTQPLFNAGKLKKIFKKTEAQRNEALLGFKQAYINALESIENSLSAEKNQKSLLKNINERLVLATNNVEEAKFQYANGLVDYLNVLNALSVLHNLEIQVIETQRNLLETRINLILSIGGPLAYPEQKLE